MMSDYIVSIPTHINEWICPHECEFQITYQRDDGQILSCIGQTTLGNQDLLVQRRKPTEEILSKIYRDEIRNIISIKIYLYTKTNQWGDQIKKLERRLFDHVLADRQVIVKDRFGRKHLEHFQNVIDQDLTDLGLDEPFEIPFEITENYYYETDEEEFEPIDQSSYSDNDSDGFIAKDDFDNDSDDDSEDDSDNDSDQMDELEDELSELLAGQEEFEKMLHRYNRAQCQRA